MGATTSISVFHHDRYRSCVVPAFRRLLRTGELQPWLAAAWEHRQNRYPATIGRPFGYDQAPEFSANLDADLRETGANNSEWFPWPSRGTQERENLIDLFQCVVESCCLGESLSMRRSGLSQFPDTYETTHELQSSLWFLRSSGLVWNDGTGGFMEGICGWTTPEETAILARELHAMTLQDHPPEPSLANTAPQDYYHQQALYRLWQLREIADRAWETGNGLLCGNDLELPDAPFARRFDAPHPSYATETVQQLARVIRDRREFDVLPVLADALQEAGCENDVVLTHCRDVNEHTDACWVADLILANANPATAGS